MVTISVRALRNPPTSQPMNVERVREVPPPSSETNHLRVPPPFSAPSLSSQPMSRSVLPRLPWLETQSRPALRSHWSTESASSAMPHGSCSSHLLPGAPLSSWILRRAGPRPEHSISNPRSRREGGLGAAGPDQGTCNAPTCSSRPVCSALRLSLSPNPFLRAVLTSSLFHISRPPLIGPAQLNAPVYTL